jgi:hypothetical protein
MIRTVYVNTVVIRATARLRILLWIFFIALFPLLIVFLLSSSSKLERSIGISLPVALGVLALLMGVAIVYAIKIWKCPVCDKSLGGDVNVCSCPRCGTYLSMPRTAEAILTQDRDLAKGAAFISHAEHTEHLNSERVSKIKRRVQLQIISFLLIALFIGGLVAFGDYNEQRIYGQGPIEPGRIFFSFFLYLAGTFSYCFTGAQLYFLNERLSAVSESRFVKVVAAILTISIVRVIIVFIAGSIIFVCTFGLHGMYQFYKAVMTIRNPLDTRINPA